MPEKSPDPIDFRDRSGVFPADSPFHPDEWCAKLPGGDLMVVEGTRNEPRYFDTADEALSAIGRTRTGRRRPGME